MLSGQQLVQLQQAQAKLDHMIFTRHHTSREHTYGQRRLALMVELAELANVERTFKYWCRPRPCNRSQLVEEYVDALHFLLSISLDFKVDFSKTKVVNISDDPAVRRQSTPALFLTLFTNCQQLCSNTNLVGFWRLLRLFFRLAVSLRLPDDAIWQAYWTKHQINHQRQLMLY